MARKKKGEVVSMKQMEDQMALQVSDATARIAQPVGNVIGIRASRFTYKTENIGDVLDIIVLDFINQHTWFDSDFDPDNPLPPACFSQSVSGEEMQPHPTSPRVQSEWCDGCSKNAWGSSDKGSGEGKACNQQYKLAVMEPADDAAEADIAMLTVPPTSLKNWDGYVRDLAKIGRSPNSVITQITFDEGADFPLLCFTADKQINKPEYFAGICARFDEARKMLMEPIDVSNYEAPKKRKASKKKTAGKKKGKRARKF